ncbi:MAG: UbiA family prenyltransferase [Candidatus Aenigmatarchaeota archaeon]
MLRTPNAFMSVIAVLISAILVSFYAPFQLAISCLVVFLISGAGMVINDYFDYDADRINRPKRALPSGKIYRKSALIYSITLFVIGNVLAYFLNFQMLAIVLFNTLLSIIYSWKLKKMALVGNFAVSWMTASVFLFGSLLSGGIGATAFILFIISFLSSVGREITKAIEDVEGDLKIKARTLPIIAGKNFSSWIAAFFIIFAVLFSPLPYMFRLLNINYVFLVTIADALFLYSCFAIMISPKKAQKMMKVAMFIGLIAFLAGNL